MKERVGIFGGTFDPPHRAHLRVALAACETLSLDRLLWIPAGRPPHKEGVSLSEPHHRMEMTRLMTDEDVRFRLELGEITSEEVSWTVDTLERIHHAQPEWDLVLIMGEDQWEAFDTWHRPDAIRSLAGIAVYRRPGSNHAANQQSASTGSATGPPDHWLPGESMDHASTRIREALASGEPVDGLLLPSVAAYIKEHSLYG